MGEPLHFLQLHFANQKAFAPFCCRHASPTGAKGSGGVTNTALKLNISKGAFR
eukprot:SAG11_NODE_138_length_15111_cov_11.388289_8_plen_53_part_00